MIGGPEMDTSYLSSFNARWLTPEQVALQFVPVPQHTKLVHTQHSLLMGPRGSGKTTLLKMLTRRALKVWDKERRGVDTHSLIRPNFEALYIPSDIRWSYEISEIAMHPSLSCPLAEQAQRVFVAGSAVVALCDAFRVIIDGDIEAEHILAESLIDLLRLERTLPLLADVVLSVEKLGGTIRGVLNRYNEDLILSLLDNLPDIFFSHTVDLPIQCCRLFQHKTGIEPQGGKWALCYDELEIAPAWMQREMLESQRSIDQDFLLKLTYSPLLPTQVRSIPEASQDFQKIRLWHSHVEDSREFCENLTNSFLSKRAQINLTADDFLHYSILGADDVIDDPDDRSYERGSTFYEQMQALAAVDVSFREALTSHSISPEDPYSDSSSLRDTFFRKIKPIVVLRNTFIKSKGRRSRKIITAYAGKQAVFAMSEGNPRWLLGILSDLFDKWLVTDMRDPETGKPTLRYNDQARLLNVAARRFHTALSAVATGIPECRPDNSPTLVALLDTIGKALQDVVLGIDFPIDPTGSFIVDEDVSPHVEQLLKRGVEIGAVIFVGKAQEDVPTEMRRSRFRLSFMLSPVYRLPFRNYPPVALSSLLSRIVDPHQLDLFSESLGGTE